MSLLRTKLSKIADYPAYLDDAWKDHLAPRAENAPTVISTFAGCGGSLLGYSMAGFRELLAVEWDEHAVQTFKANFPDVPVYHGDIAKFSVEQCLNTAGIKVGELDVFDGSPPCQGFSTAGKRKFSDDRNQLFREYIRLLRGLNPKMVVMENVSGMVKGKMKLIFAEILRELKACGYRVSARLLNAMYFGVPQSRERMIFIGIREDLSFSPSHPTAITIPIPLKDVLPSLAATRIQAINPWIDASKSAACLLKTNSGYEGLPAFSDKYAKLYDQVPMGGNASDVIGKGYNNCVKPHIDKPSMTLPKLQTGHGFATIVHPTEPRALTIEEAKIIGSFPFEFKLDGSYSNQWARIGNSVPPLFMRAIAKHIRTEILDKISLNQNTAR